jgi:hypothetical protein
MEVKEHFYADNPRAGPPDAWTTLPGVDYYFLGNGRIQAAVQVCRKGRGSAAGLLVMDPERLGPKSAALSFDRASGLRLTLLQVEIGGRRVSARPGKVEARWLRIDGVPAAEVFWRGSSLAIREAFFCPDRRGPRVVRRMTIKNQGRKAARAVLQTGIPGQALSRRLSLAPGAGKALFIEYRLVGAPGQKRVRASWCGPPRVTEEVRMYWRQAARIRFPDRLLSHFFDASLFQLQASLAATGKLDGSIWQYNREWTRDQAMAAIALTLSGQFELAGTLLRRLLSSFVTPEGETIDSSERRPADECELDQNGALLVAIEIYLLWTCDLALLRKFWKKIAAAAEFPLGDVFRHVPSGLLHNRREFWERHAAHGIEDGIELAHQLWVSLGLSSASRLAALLRKKTEAARWETEARRIKKAMLSDQQFGLISNGVFIKRRNVAGEVQVEVHPPPGLGLPQEVPLFSPGRHFLNPDTSTVLPIAWEFVPPRSKLGARTLRQVERLWNQRWKGGGYGRYHVSSEPDSPGPWPFPSLFVARSYLEAGEEAKVRRILRWLGRAAGGRAGTWFEFYGPRPVPPFPQVGIVPWNWVEMLMLLLHHLVGVRPEWGGLRLRPRLLKGLNGYRASVRVREVRISLTVEKTSRRATGFEVADKFYPYAEEGLLLPFPGSDMRVRARIPPPTGARKR